MFRRRIRVLILLALTLVLSVQNVQGDTAEQKANQEEAIAQAAVSSVMEGTPVEVPEWISKPIFQYSATGRPDPFSSFLKAQAARQHRRAQDTSRALSPLERFEVTQLKVVGIIHNNLEPEKVVAMVELPDGKGFVLKKGERVGMNQGRVVLISNDQVQVIEESEDLFGDIVTRSVVLKLQTAQGERK
jgi:type IV pilus assembly protein PilP